MIAVRSRRIGQRYHIGDKDKTSPDYRCSYSAGRLTSDGGRCCRPGGEDRFPRRERVLQTTTKRIHLRRPERNSGRERRPNGEDQLPTIGRCCGLCGEKEHFPAENEREKLYYQPALDIESRNGEDPRPSRVDGHSRHGLG